MEAFLEAVFSMWSMHRSYNEGISRVAVKRSSGESKTQYLGVQLGQAVPGGYKYRDLAFLVGTVSYLRQQNIVMCPRDSDLRMTLLMKTSSDCK
jgi:hypothetical protein